MERLSRMDRLRNGADRRPRSARLTVLRAYRSPDREGWTGTWIDGYGGALEIDTAPRDAGRFTFAIEVVRGSTAHTGSITGVAETRGAIAFFSDGADPVPTWIVLLRRPHTIKVVTANSERYHGLRAYFDGVYVRDASSRW